MKVYVIRQFDRKDYKGHHVGVAADRLTAEIFAQKYVKEHFGGQAVYYQDEWDNLDVESVGENYREFHANGEDYCMIVAENNLITAEDLTKDFSN